jgi:hypothetical protein
MMISFNRDTTRGLAAAAVLCTVLGGTSAAHAITDQERWAAHQELARAQDLKKQGQLQEALSHFAESHRLDPKLATMMELADCEEQLGKFVEAQGHFAAARDKAAQERLPQSKARAEERLAALDKRVAHLTLQLPADAPAGTQVLLDDVPVEPASLGTSMTRNPGDLVVVVKTPGRDDAKYPVKLAEGDNQTLPLAVAPAPRAAPPPPPPKAAPPPPKQDEAQLSVGTGSSRRTLGIVAGSVGVVGLGVGGVFWSLGWRDRSTLGPSSDRNMLIGQISVISGAVLLATGVVLYVTAPSGETKNARLTVAPTLTVANGATVLGAAGAF